MTTSLTDANGIGYIVDNPVEKKFLQNPNFCLSLQNYAENFLSISIAVIPQHLSDNQQNSKKSRSGYTIQLLGTHENRAKLEQSISDFIKKLFQSIKSKIFNDDKVKEWLHHPSSIITNHLTCLQNIMNEKLSQIFTVCEIDTENSLKIYYLPKEPFSQCHTKEIDNIIPNKISQEIIFLPLQYEQSTMLKNELNKLIDDTTTKQDLSISFNFIQSKSIILFGYYRTINRLKQEILKLIEKYQLLIFKFNSLNISQIDFLRDTCAQKLRKIEEKYIDIGVKLRLIDNEFLAPQYLKDEIESRIKQLLSHSMHTKTFQSIQLFKHIAEQAEKYLKTIAKKNHCYINTELEQEFRYYSIPKAIPSNRQISKSILEQSEEFRHSMNVIHGITIKNGSIEIRTGDIAFQKVDAIVISTTTNGLKEGVIERAGRFNHEQTYTDTITGIQFTETHGGILNCKQILFSNWIPLIDFDNENQLRKSIQIFLSKSIEYIMKDKNSSFTIAFSICDSCKNEMILAEEMISIAKQIIESKYLQLKIIFVLLPEQEILHNYFCTILDSIQDGYSQLEWANIVIKITLIASQDEYLIKCQEKIENYLKRSITSSKIENSNGIFEHWNQHTINLFYKYCKDKYVLPHIDKTRNKIKLTGQINNLIEVKQKLYFLSINNGRIREQSSRIRNIMISFCQQDEKLCQRLVNRLIDEGFSVWAEPINIEQQQQRNVSSQMNKSDCIILCISENSLYENEAIYAFQTGKLVFPVKIRNHRLLDWQREIFKEKLFFQLFGSENHFDLEFERLLLEILRKTTVGYDVGLQQEKDDFQQLLTIDERRSKYDEKIRRLTEIGRIDKKEMKNLIEQLQNVINDVVDRKTEKEKEEEENENSYRFNRRDRMKKKEVDHWKYLSSIEQLVRCANRWLSKPTNITKQNLIPFSISGDINDALFPIPEDMLNNKNQLFRSLSSPFGTSLRSISFIDRCLTRGLHTTIPIEEDCTYGLSTRKTRYDGSLFQIFSQTDFTEDFIPRKTMRNPLWSFIGARWSNGYTRKSITYSSSSTKTLQKPRKLNKPSTIEGGDEQNMTRPVKTYLTLTQEERAAYKEKFAQRMRENAIQFENFCLTYKVVKKKTVKQ